MKTVVIVPVFNEEVRAVETISEIKKYFKGEIVVVDDGSTDDTFNQLKEIKNIKLLRHVINLGKGAAMRTGIKMAQKLKYEAVIFIDADGQHNPSHLKKFEDALENTDLVFGYRNLEVGMPYVRKIGNLISIYLIKKMFKITRADLLCGYFGFKQSIYPKIKWTSSRYGVETEIACRAGKNQIPFKEVKIDTIYIDKYKGVTIFDAFKILFQLPFWYLRK